MQEPIRHIEKYLTDLPRAHIHQEQISSMAHDNSGTGTSLHRQEPGEASLYLAQTDVLRKWA